MLQHLLFSDQTESFSLGGFESVGMVAAAAAAVVVVADTPLKDLMMAWIDLDHHHHQLDCLASATYSLLPCWQQPRESSYF
jgi:hypothetical protein